MRSLPESTMPHQRFHDLQVEFGAGNLADDFEGGLGIHGGLVGTVGGHGVQGVGDRDDAGHQGDLVAFEAVGIALAVDVFVVQLDSGKHVFELRDRAHDVGALCWGAAS